MTKTTTKPTIVYAERSIIQRGISFKNDLYIVDNNGAANVNDYDDPRLVPNYYGFSQSFLHYNFYTDIFV